MSEHRWLQRTKLVSPKMAEELTKDYEAGAPYWYMQRKLRDRHNIIFNQTLIYFYMTEVLKLPKRAKYGHNTVNYRQWRDKQGLKDSY